MIEPTLWSFISNASLVVKAVMLLLLLASIASWTLIIQRIMAFRQLRKQTKDFEQHFHTVDVNRLYQQLADYQPQKGLSRIFYAGFKELQQSANNTPSMALTSSQRAMHITTTQEIDQLQQHLNFLATVGSTSPYVGLFGTVWGIMSAFRALGMANQATISLVAPGIAEALIATAIGLFAAIPAVIGYNRLSNQAERLATHYENFQALLVTQFERQLNAHVQGSKHLA